MRSGVRIFASAECQVSGGGATIFRACTGTAIVIFGRAGERKKSPCGDFFYIKGAPLDDLAAERIRNITASSWIEVRYAGARETTAALNIFSKFADQDLSFTDAVSFAVMRQEGLRDAISFDSHFERAGFRIWKAGR